MKDKNKTIKLVIPKGKIYQKVVDLLNEAGFNITENGRSYRPSSAFPWLELKILKPQNIAKLIELGQHDIGFTGYDWIYESDADVEELTDLGFDSVKIVAAVPVGLNKNLKKDKVIVASEYSKITGEFLKKEKINYIFIRSFGSTEVFPPEDADMIVDNTSTGATLKENNLEIVKEVLESSTRFIANKEAMKDEWKSKKIQDIKTILESILVARKRVILEMNVSEENMPGLIKELPCMKSPTMNKLYEGGYAVKSAVLRKDIAKVIPKIKKAGATDILEYNINKIVL